ncbi:uncharacterized protein LOC133538149 isoform X3 [Nerophis ophidion]|uniref:uncharacterized protein LOC133538149 isoform X3 n=1 Tax=Nerophis ophidion TaxID=159077 RepID=UPI002ADFC46E|nr:uncharacterized protein LOC133538149 isoform X3 [Nerophis ophidion]
MCERKTAKYEDELSRTKEENRRRLRGAVFQKHQVVSHGTGSSLRNFHDTYQKCSNNCCPGKTQAHMERHKHQSGIKELQKRIQSMEMRCYRRLMGISYTQYVTNEEVRQKVSQAVGPHDDLLTTGIERKLVWYGGTRR